MKNFLIRTATGAIFVAVLLGGMLYNKYTFGILFALLTMLAVREFCGLVKEYKKTTFSTVAAVVGGAYLFFALFVRNHLGGEYSLQLFAPYMGIVILVFIAQLFDTKSKPLDNFAYFVFSQVYTALPFALLNVLSTAGAAGGESYSFVLPLSIFVFIWSNDSGAFCFGCTLGKHKMFERVSPKKTWEGFAGGAFVAVVAGVVLSHFLGMDWNGHYGCYHSDIRRPHRILYQTRNADKGFGQSTAGPRRYARPFRQHTACCSCGYYLLKLYWSSPLTARLFCRQRAGTRPAPPRYPAYGYTR